MTTVYARPALTDIGDEWPSLAAEMAAVLLPVWRLVVWLARYLLDSLVAVLTHPDAGRHADRPHEGASDESAAELADIRESLTDTDVIPLPLAGWALETTRAWTDAERLDADATFGETARLLPLPDDATEIALTGGTRVLDGGA